MKDPRRKIEEFCYRHPNFGIPNLMRYIVIANVVFWLFNAVNPMIMPYLLFNPAMILRGQIWRLISFVFIPPSTGVLAFIAFYFYYWIGTTLENQWGTGQFTIYFFSGVILPPVGHHEPLPGESAAGGGGAELPHLLRRGAQKHAAAQKEQGHD